MSGSDFSTSFDFSGDTADFDFSGSDFSFDNSVSFEPSADLSLSSDISFDMPEFDFADITLPTFDADTSFDFEALNDAPIFSTPSEALQDISLPSETSDILSDGLAAFGSLDVADQSPVIDNAPLFGSIAVAGIAAVAELINGDFEADDIARIVAQGAQNYAAFKADPELLGTTEGQVQVATQVLANTGLLGQEFSAVLQGVSQGIDQDWSEVDEIVLNGVNTLRASGILGEDADPILAGIAAVAEHGDADTIEVAIKNLVAAGIEDGIVPRNAAGLLNLALDTNVLERLFGEGESNSGYEISDSGVRLNTSPNFTLDPGLSGSLNIQSNENITFASGTEFSDPDE